MTARPASRAPAELEGDGRRPDGCGLGGGGRCDWLSAVATATIGPCVRSDVSVVAAVGIQKWRVWRGLVAAGARSVGAQRRERAKERGSRGARRPVLFHCAPWHVWHGLEMEPQVSRVGAGLLTRRAGTTGGRPDADSFPRPEPGSRPASFQPARRARSVRPGAKA